MPEREPGMMQTKTLGVLFGQVGDAAAERPVVCGPPAAGRAHVAEPHADTARAPRGCDRKGSPARDASRTFPAAALGTFHLRPVDLRSAA